MTAHFDLRVVKKPFQFPVSGKPLRVTSLLHPFAERTYDLAQRHGTFVPHIAHPLAYRTLVRQLFHAQQMLQGLIVFQTFDIRQTVSARGEPKQQRRHVNDRIIAFVFMRSGIQSGVISNPVPQPPFTRQSVHGHLPSVDRCALGALELNLNFPVFFRVVAAHQHNLQYYSICCKTSFTFWVMKSLGR